VKIAAAVIIVLVAAAAAAVFLIGRSGTTGHLENTQSETVHIHAVFQVYINNELQDYAQLKYMKIEPCGVDEETEHDEQLEKAHLHDLVGDVVHVHRSNATWGDLFKNIRVDLPEPVTGYVDGQTVTDIMSQPIKAESRVLIISGVAEAIEEKLTALPDLEHLHEVESRSESCG
jgi:hypothetical protein